MGDYGWALVARRTLLVVACGGSPDLRTKAFDEHTLERLQTNMKRQVRNFCYLGNACDLNAADYVNVPDGQRRMHETYSGSQTLRERKKALTFGVVGVAA